MECIEKIDFHDSVLTKVIVTPDNDIITFELDHIVGLSETKYEDTFKPLKRKAIVNFINYSKVNLNMVSDKNCEIILDFDLVEEKKDIVNIHVYTSNNSSIDICCEKYELNILKEDLVDENLIIIP